jgi:hypothetical protein
MGSHVIVRSLTITFARAIDLVKDSNIGGGDAIYVGGSYDRPEDDVRVEKCQVKQSWFAGVRPVWASNVVIADCTFDKCLATTIFPGEIRKGIKILRNKITNTKDDGIFVGCGKYATGTESVTIQGNTVRTSSAKGIGFGGCHDVLIQGNTIENTWFSGIQCEVTGWSRTKTRDVRIVDNIVSKVGRNYGPGKYHPAANPSAVGIFVPAAEPGAYENVEIRGNTVTDILADGIMVTRAVQFQVVGNTVNGCGTTGISVGAAMGTGTQASDFAVTGNRVSRVGRNGIYVVGAARGVIAGNSVGTYGRPDTVTDHGVFVYRAEAVIVAGNKITNEQGAGDMFAVASSTRAGRLDVGVGAVLSTNSPTTGMWSPGDVVLNSAPKPGSPLGWRCVSAGTPGQWQELDAPDG